MKMNKVAFRNNVIVATNTYIYHIIICNIIEFIKGSLYNKYKNHNEVTISVSVVIYLAVYDTATNSISR